MTSFLRDDFLLHSPTARMLYRDFAKDLPIIDYHCHIDPADIARNISFANITELWLRHDHYKWRLMRAAGVDERLITGDADDREKFNAWAGVIGRAFGNPLYHWSHLELARYFGYEGILSEKTADEVWNLTKEKLASPGYRARDLITRSNVSLLCTTDDPVDNLSWHRQIADDKSVATRVLPTFRPDRAVDIDKIDFHLYISSLAEATDMRIDSLTSLQEALESRVDFFASCGCRLADHGTEEIVYDPAEPEEIERIFRRRLAGEVLSPEEVNRYRTSMMLFFARAYHRRGWTMQLHFGCRRDNNRRMFASIGANTGFDTIADGDFVTPLAEYLDQLEQKDAMPRMILYSLNPNDNVLIDTLIACFQRGPDVGRLQHGSAWWFNDHERGIREQLLTLASQSYLPGFVGMLTDSRSFVSYTRHEYFRRILCDVLGQAVEDGSFAGDHEILGGMVRAICHDNAAGLFR